MDTQLKSFIDTVVPEGRRTAFHFADNTLQRIGVHSHLTGVENILAGADDSTTDDLILSVESVIIAHLNDQISNYGIGMKTTDLTILTHVFMGMIDLINYSDPEALLVHCETGGSPEEILSLCLADVYGHAMEDYLNSIDYVQESLIRNLEMNLQRNVDFVMATEETTSDEHEFTPQTIQQSPDLLRNFLDKYGNSRFESMLAADIRLGYDYSVYLDALLHNDLTDENPDRLAVDYMTSALASGDTVHQAVEAASERLETRFEDPVLLQKTLERIRRFLNDL